MLWCFRIVAAIALGLFAAHRGQTAIAQQSHPTESTTWHQIALGAGGLLTGIDIAPDGTMVVKTDTFGAYIWDSQSARWVQLITAASWGALQIPGAFGVWEIRIAPSMTNRIYMIWNGFTYRSDDRGKRWIKTSLRMIGNERREPPDPNGPFKLANQKMAVDPVNPNVVYVGTTSEGVWRSLDAGASWARITDIPVSTLGPGSAGIAFDGHSGTSSGRTKTIFVPVYGKGVWQSIDAGATWIQIANGATNKSPLNVWTAQVGVDGVYWCSDHANAWKFQNGVWTAMKDHTGNAMRPVQAVAVDLNQPGRVVFVTDSANSGWETLDNGASLVVKDKWFGNYPPGHSAHAATDIPWLQNSDKNYMTLGDARFDPSQDNKLYFSEGIGVWWTNWPKTFAASAYHSQSVGIEQLVATDIIAPVGAKPLLGVWDRGVFRVDDPEKYPSRHFINDWAFTAGWGLDYASSDPTFIVALNDWPGNIQSGYSSDSGRTWHLFAAQPDSQHPGGCIAASTSSNIVVVPANNGLPAYTKNGGKSWAPLTGPGRLPNDGWIAAFYLNSHIVAADRVKVGTFYIYNAVHGVYRTTDGGDSWLLVHQGPVANNSGWNARLRTAPEHIGHLWYTSGPGDGLTGQLMRSTDGGSTWRSVPNVLNVLDFGFGKSKVPGGYPAIFIVGRVNGSWGIWRSDNEGFSWMSLGKYANDNIDYVKTINGDMNTYGTAYVGFHGSGFAYGVLKGH